MAPILAKAIFPGGRGGGVLPYMGYEVSMVPKGTVFSAVFDFVINRVSILGDSGHFGHK